MKIRARFKQQISTNDGRAELGALAVLAGLLLEVALAFKFRTHKSFFEEWGPLIANALIAIGVYVEIHFGRKASNESAERVAEATERASEARRALEKYKTPRRLTAETCSQIAGKLKPFAETTFVMSAVGPEPIDLAIDTANALIAAGWQWKDWREGGS